MRASAVFLPGVLVATLITMIASGVTQTASAAPAEFSEANEAYLAGDFQKARSLYESVARSGHYSANLFFNLGNADFRLGDRGRSALNYRRALVLRPGLAEASANLRLVRDEANSKIAPLHPVEKVLPTFPRNSWTIATSITGWLSIFLITALATGYRRAAVWLGTFGVLLLFACSATGLWFQRSERNLAVIVADKTEARRAPANTAKIAETLPAASEVDILLTRGQWTYCVLPDGERAWVPADTVERVILTES